VLLSLQQDGKNAILFRYVHSSSGVEAIAHRVEILRQSGLLKNGPIWCIWTSYSKKLGVS